MDFFKASKFIGFNGNLSQQSQEIMTVNIRDFIKAIIFQNLSRKYRTNILNLKLLELNFNKKEVLII